MRVQFANIHIFISRLIISYCKKSSYQYKVDKPKGNINE